MVMKQAMANHTPRHAGGTNSRCRMIFASSFREKSGSIICRDLLKDVPVSPGPEPEERTPEYYAVRPCPQLAWQAAAILDEMLTEIQVSGENRENKP